MEMVKFYLRKATKGQTMTEYALILAAIAVVVFAVYQTLGSQIVTLVTTEIIPALQ